MGLFCRNLLKLSRYHADYSRTLPISTTSSQFFILRWGPESKPNPNQNKTMRDLPDYSFLDGRPTPYGARHRLRIEKQREYTKKIITLTKEVEFAEQLYKERLAKKKAEEDERIAGKLMSKGDRYLDE